MLPSLIQSHRRWTEFGNQEAHTLGTGRSFSSGYLARILDISLPDYVWQKAQSDTKIKSRLGWFANICLAGQMAHWALQKDPSSISDLSKLYRNSSNIYILRNSSKFCGI
jgi:hypothetical protein